MNLIDNKRECSKIIACSAYKSEEDKRKAKKIGMVDYIEKPISKMNIETIIKKYFWIIIKNCYRE